MKTKCGLLFAITMLMLSCAQWGWAGTEGAGSTFYGTNAGLNNSADSNSNTLVGAGAGLGITTGKYNAFLGYATGFTATTPIGNTFIGYGAGSATTTGGDNVFVGFSGGLYNTTGTRNVFVGSSAGLSNTAGMHNTVLGFGAGSGNATGNENLFLGYKAGSAETGSNKLYIDNCLNGNPCTPPFIYGEFDNHLLKVNGVLNVAANSVAKSQMHFSQNDTDTGGFLTSVLDNNFFVSSGARYDGTAGGWIQRSSDTNAVIAGSGGAGYRIFTHTGTAVGSTFTPTVRLHIDYSGQFGINTAPVAGHEIHTATGAYEAGGTWVNGSSRELKDHIGKLSLHAAEEALAGLQPVTFQYKTDPAWQHVGFIAEDVPELVASPDRKGLSPMDIVAVLTKVVQEQKALISTQQQALRSMEANFSRLEGEVARLKR